MRALVTGAAGFIGSTLVDWLLMEGHEVIGVDSFSPYYSEKTKRDNLEVALSFDNFRLMEVDLSNDPLTGLLDGVTDIFHQAGQPGVRASWGRDFDTYVRLNIIATQRLLEEARECETLLAFVAASSSSIYGSAERLPTSEDVLPKPISPYGVTKLAAENLCTLYGTQHNVPTVSLRYFTVYGPRQRPDMAINRLMKCGLSGDEFTLMGNGRQSRDFTHVDDIVRANLAASSFARESSGGTVFNVGGGNPIELQSVIELIERHLNCRIRITQTDSSFGDPTSTCADASAARRNLKWSSQVSFSDGIKMTVDAMQSH
ncbi:MAG: NAD-dependent epimerase/dehydratase family protein [Actinobacteria bacterium]|nr:NAD-dependent epimerase/dehydratase family protein [Actinomycetota bacterium]